MAERNNLPLVGGVIVGATLGAAASFLFGTPEGKKLRGDLRKKFPEIFGTLDELAESSKEYLQELPASLVEDAKLLVQEALDQEEKPKQGVQEGRILPSGSPTGRVKHARVVKGKQRKYNKDTSADED